MDEFFKVDDLLNFPNEEHIFSSTTDHSDHQYHHHQHYHQQQAVQQFNSSSEHTDHQIKSYYTNSTINHNNSNPLRYNNNNNTSFSSVTIGAPHFSYDFTDQLCVPNDDVAELEWLSNFVDDSFTDFNTNDLTRTLISQSHTSSSIPSAARSKRSRQRTWKASASPISSSTASHSTKINHNNNNNSPIDDSTTSSSGGVRRCTHCASEKTPQWRTGPMGPKTLCNACGVRYKSGRLVPEYRPAASPTFVLTQHSNSHRKVMELRRQKEVTIKGGHANQAYRHHDFEVC